MGDFLIFGQFLPTTKSGKKNMSIKFHYTSIQLVCVFLFLGCSSGPDLTRDSKFRVSELKDETPAEGELKENATFVSDHRKKKRFRSLANENEDELSDGEDSEGGDLETAGVDRQGSELETASVDTKERISPKGLSSTKTGGNRQPANAQDSGWIWYVVRPGDTLMKISFQHYGSVFKWREIIGWNSETVKSSAFLSPGTRIRLGGKKSPPIRPSGDPYRILIGDTLLKISSQLYGTRKYWWNLWENNRQLVTNPNRIYAGFTLYYLNREKVLGSKSQNLYPLASVANEGKKTAQKREVRKGGFPKYERPNLQRSVSSTKE
jgi:hypothetical protein